MFTHGSMRDLRQKILDVASRLAEEGGFNNVRQRDVAAEAGVALRTLYKRFRSKEDILSAVLVREVEAMKGRLQEEPIEGSTPVERVLSFFELLSKTLFDKPQFARAVIRAVASGEPEVANNVMSYHGQITELVIASMRGEGSLSGSDRLPTERETTLALLLQQLWFAAMVGWAGQLHGEAGVMEQVKLTADLLDRGLTARATPPPAAVDAGEPGV